MNIIILIITEGCIACKIAIKILKQAISKTNINIEFKIVDCFDLNYKKFIKENNISDFPTTVFIKNDNIVNICIGTITVSEFIKKINTLFG